MQQYHVVLTRLMADREVDHAQLLNRLHEAGYKYNSEYFYWGMAGVVDMKEDLLGDIARVLDLNRKEVRELAEAHLNRGHPVYQD